MKPNRSGDTMPAQTSENNDSVRVEASGSVSEQTPPIIETLEVVDYDYAHKALPSLAKFSRIARLFILMFSVIYAVIFFYCAQSQARKFWQNDGMINPATFNDQREILIGLMAYAVLVWSLCCHEIYFVLSIRVVDNTKALS